MAMTQAKTARTIAARIQPPADPPPELFVSAGLRGVVGPVGPSFSGRSRGAEAGVNDGVGAWPVFPQEYRVSPCSR